MRVNAAGKGGKSGEEKLQMQRKTIRMKLKDRNYNMANTLYKMLRMSTKHIGMTCATIATLPKKSSVKKVSSNLKQKDDFKNKKLLSAYLINASEYICNRGLTAWH